MSRKRLSRGDTRVTNPDFDAVASFYYPLSRIIFAGTQDRAQEVFVQDIQPGSRILIVGGGDGRVLCSFSRYPQLVSEITFVERSGKMLEKARMQNYGSVPVHFVEADIEEYLNSPGVAFYDAIHTAFFFDLFPPEKADALFRQLYRHLKPGGLWMYSDFRSAGTSPRWQRLMLKTMYALFRRTTGVRASFVPDMEQIRGEDLKLMKQYLFYGGFITSELWEKMSDKE